MDVPEKVLLSVAGIVDIKWKWRELAAMVSATQCDQGQGQSCCPSSQINPEFCAARNRGPNINIPQATSSGQAAIKWVI